MNDIRKEIPRETCRNYLNQALAITDEIRAGILAKVESGFQVTRKPDNSVVTDVDVEMERLFRSRIRQLFPDHTIIGEELASDNGESDFQWIIDPIDGTEEFINHIPTYGTIISLHYKGVPILGIIDHPAIVSRVHAAFGFGTFYNGKRIHLDETADTMFPGKERVFITPYASFLRWGDDKTHLFNKIVSAFPNIRILHAAFVYTCAVTGSADAMVEYNVCVWDLAACQILVEEAGGAYHCIQKQQRENGDVSYGAVFGRPEMVGKLLPFFDPKPNTQ